MIAVTTISVGWLDREEKFGRNGLGGRKSDLAGGDGTGGKEPVLKGRDQSFGKPGPVA
jgi:hypothetical protein